MLDPALAHKDKAPERLYRSTIPCLTAYLRPGCVKRSKEFDFFFNKITSCYQFLLLSLYRKTDDIYKATAGTRM